MAETASAPVAAVRRVTLQWPNIFGRHAPWRGLRDKRARASWRFSMPISFLVLILGLLAPGAASYADAGAASVDGSVPSQISKLPVAIVLDISDEIVGLERKFRANAITGKKYDFEVKVGQKFGDAIERATHSIFRDVYMVSTEGLPTIRFDLGNYESNINLRDGPFSVDATVSTRVALRVTILNAGAAPIFSTTAEGDSTISRTVLFSGVSQGPLLVEETSINAIDQALEKLGEVLRDNSGLDFYGTTQGRM